MTDQQKKAVEEAYIQKDCLDMEIKPLVLKWLCDKFGYKSYPHSHADQWINWHIFDGRLSIGFDHRQEEQVKLLSLIPCQLRGAPQSGTLKIVNDDYFYLQLKDAVHIKYPEITGHRLINKEKHVDNDGDTFYVYNWEVSLSDGTSIKYRNQNANMDLTKRSFSYDSIIQERCFVEFLISKYKS